MFESHDSFDHLISADQHALWDREAERLGGLQVDDELELGRLLGGLQERKGAVVHDRLLSGLVAAVKSPSSALP